MTHPLRVFLVSALVLLAGLTAGARGQTYPDRIAAALKTVDDTAGRGPFQPVVPGVGALTSIERNWCTPRALR